MRENGSPTPNPEIMHNPNVQGLSVGSKISAANSYNTLPQPSIENEWWNQPPTPNAPSPSHYYDKEAQQGESEIIDRTIEINTDSIFYKAGKFIGKSLLKARQAAGNTTPSNPTSEPTQEIVIELKSTLPEPSTETVWWTEPKQVTKKLDWDTDIWKNDTPNWQTYSNFEKRIPNDDMLHEMKLTSTEEALLDLLGYDPDSLEAREMILEARTISENEPQISERSIETEENRPAHLVNLQEVAEAEHAIDGEEVFELLEVNKVVKHAPRFADLLSDGKRTNILRHYIGEGASYGAEAPSIELERLATEFESLQDFRQFLEDVISLEGTSTYLDDRDKELLETAKDMHENLTFIGEKERNEAAKGIAEYWKGILRNNPNAQLCVLTEIASDPSRIKSDKYLFDTVLGNFTDEEIQNFGPRIVESLQAITGDLDNVRVIMLDDWVISGSQMRSAYSSVSSNPRFNEIKDKIEIQLVTSSRSRIENGLLIESGNGMGSEVRVPIRSYFMSHEASRPTAFYGSEHNSYESGAHSSVDYDFESSYIERMLTLLNEGLYGQDRRMMPGITRIIREYRSSKLANISRLRNGSQQSNGASYETV